MSTLSRPGLWLLLALAAIAGASSARAAQVGVSSQGSGGAWGSTSTWAGGAVPDNAGGTTYAVSIDAGSPTNSTVSISASTSHVGFTVDSLTIDAGDKLSLTANDFGFVGPTASLSLNGGLTVNGAITFQGVGTGQEYINIGANQTVNGAGSFTTGSTSAIAMITSGGGDMTLGSQLHLFAGVPSSLYFETPATLHFQGTATATASGHIRLLGNSVINTGTIVSSASSSQMEVGKTGQPNSFTNSGFTSVDATSSFSAFGGMAVADGGIAEVRLGNQDGTNSNGRYSISGDLDLSSLDDTIRLTKLVNYVPNRNYLVMTYAGSLVGTFDHVTDGFVLDYSTPGKIFAHELPEPASALVGSIAAIGFCVSRRAR